MHAYLSKVNSSALTSTLAWSLHTFDSCADAMRVLSSSHLRLVVLLVSSAFMRSCIDTMTSSMDEMSLVQSANV